jgi:alpha-ketoglutarate-dependent taurine dioxygenase
VTVAYQDVTTPAIEDALGPDVRLSLYQDGPLPLFVTPAGDRSMERNVEWLHAHRAAIDAALLHHGAVVLRNFGFATASDIKLALSDRAKYGQSYAAGQAPRAMVDEYVFEATAAPADRLLRLHQEMAYLPRQPDRIVFFSEVPAESGGETIIADMRRFTGRVGPAFRNQLEQRGIKYLSNFMDKDKLKTLDQVFGNWHKSWQDAFSSDDRSVAEDSCRSLGLEWAWREDGGLDTWHVTEAFRNHPVTGERVWFNMIATQTPSRFYLGSDEAYARFLRAYGTGALPPPFRACYGDGSDFDTDDVLSLYPLYEDLTVAFPWQKGDLMFVDNVFTAHGRNPFGGERQTRVVLLG